MTEEKPNHVSCTVSSCFSIMHQSHFITSVGVVSYSPCGFNFWNGRLTHLNHQSGAARASADEGGKKFAVGLFLEQGKLLPIFTEELYPLQPKMGTVNKMMVCRYCLFPSPNIFRFDVSFLVFMRFGILGYWENLKSDHSATVRAMGWELSSKSIKWWHLSQFNLSILVGCVATLKTGGSILW